jgi:radical SAM protein with 4Fe4S-binding SPASM domain
MKYVLFGAGYFGKQALREYGKDNVICIWDNDITKHGKYMDGIPIVEFLNRNEIEEDFKIILCTIYYSEIIEQLEDACLNNYEIYHEVIIWNSYYSHKILVENPYDNNCDRDLSEQEWMEKNNGKLKRGAINRKVEQLYKEHHLFHHVEIETINRCNGACSFCPVSVKNEQRPYAMMDDNLFKKIIEQLSELNYSGRLSLFSNNEPLLDKRIVEFHKYARERLPLARMHLFTNGTLLTKDIFLQLVEYLDELIVDNYNQELQLTPASKMIMEYAQENPDIQKKVTVVLRKPDEILTSRGGDAPNRTQVSIEKNISCVHPFQQLIVRPDGKVSLCCNDPLGKSTMGDVNVNSLVDIWYGEKYESVRQAIFNGRENFEHCKNCDVFVLD